MSFKRVAILQSNYIPWKGYFDMIHRADEFVLYDDVQYTRRDWRNRNKIKTTDGVHWLTIPVEVSGKFFQAIRDTKVVHSNWAGDHWETIRRNYSKAPFFKEYHDLFADLYLNCQETYLSLINHRFLMAINQILGIQTKISWSHDYQLLEGKTERLVHLCKQTGANEYISGPAAKDYIDPLMFEKENIKLSWMDYSGYSVYRQQHGDFDHAVSIIDLIFNEGKNATAFMNSFKKSCPTP